MHLGHAFSYSQQDFVARFKRMSGHAVFYPFGTDDNGLATEKIVQKHAQNSWNKNISFYESLINDRLINKRISNRNISTMFDLKYHTKKINTIFKRVCK